MTKHQCPNCHSYRVEPRYGRPVLAFLSITLIGIPLILAIIGLLFVPIGIVGMVLSYALLKGEVCRTCGWQSEEKPARGKNASPLY